MVQQSKGIVLKTVKYGDTSIITTIYTELFGVQSYLVKGVRKARKTSPGKVNYFQPGAILDLTVNQNPLKSLQYLKDFEWAHLYQNIFFNVVRSAVATYITELIGRSIQEPEENPELFSFFEKSLLHIDRSNELAIADFPLLFTIKFADLLGFRIHGQYCPETPVLDLQEGRFVIRKPDHPYFIENKYAEISSFFNNCSSLNPPEDLCLNQTTRRALLNSYQQFFSLHLENIGALRSLSVLQGVL